MAIVRRQRESRGSDEWPPCWDRNRFFTIRADLAAITDLGRTPYGQRRIIDILGGTVKGDRLNGRVLPGGADWQIIRNDGAADIQARYTIQTETGARILVPGNGLRHGPPEVLERRTRGEKVEPSLYYFRRAVMRSETADPSVDWLNRILARGSWPA